MKYKIGMKIGHITLLDKKRENNRTLYLVKCDLCNSKKWIRIEKTTKSCGCLGKNTQRKPIDLTGKKFSRLTALNSTESKNKQGSYIWKCKCDCGNETLVSAQNLMNGNVKSCGCLKIETMKKNQKIAKKKLYACVIRDGTHIRLIKNSLSGKQMKSNTSGTTGVKFDRTRNKWIAELTFKGVYHYLGRYDKKADAIKARKEAENKYFRDYLNKDCNIDK